MRFRPWAYGDVWDAMTPAQRRRALLGDVILAGGGAMGLLWWLW